MVLMWYWQHFYYLQKLEYLKALPTKFAGWSVSQLICKIYNSCHKLYVRHKGWQIPHVGYNTYQAMDIVFPFWSDFGHIAKSS